MRYVICVDLGFFLVVVIDHKPQAKAMGLGLK